MSVLLASTQKLVEENLVKRGLLTTEVLGQCRQKAEEGKVPFLSFLVNQKIIDPEELTRSIARVTKVPYVNLTDTKLDQKVLDLLPKEIAERYMAVPLGMMQNRLVVAMIDADNVQAVDFLSSKIGQPLKVYLASETGIRSVLSQYAADFSDELKTDDAEDQDSIKRGDKSPSNLKNLVQDSPISKALSAMLEYASSNRASDIHIEPLEKELKIRVRVDGVLREIMKLSKSVEAPLVSRVKILANLKIDEHRVPQDGQFSIKVGSKSIDLRIAISPVVWGEQVVIRLLDKTGMAFDLEGMGYTGRALRTIREGIKRPNGMILTSGPTGSGKSTSMYALIKEIKNDTINIVTLEDPVEYKIDGVNQIQINPAVGLTFASGLKSVLRQDPDVVLVGEIRDAETAALAVQAALTGHLVFSTLHTNSAAGILPRLLDMGIEPFLIASTVNTVIGQRLVRRNLDDKEVFTTNEIETKAIQDTVGHLLPKNEEDRKEVSLELGYNNLPLADQKAYNLARGKDGPLHPGGFKGRIGLYEVFNVTDSIRNLITKKSSSSEIENQAISEGMITMRQDGYLKALAGLTTIKEVDRVSAVDNA